MAKIKYSVIKKKQNSKGKKKVPQPKSTKAQSKPCQTIKKPPAKKAKLKVKAKNQEDYELDEEVLQDFAENQVSDEESNEEIENLEEPQSKKKKLLEDTTDLERAYTKTSALEKRSKKPVVDLLPIKGPDGQIITRTAAIENNAIETKTNDIDESKESSEEEIEAFEDSDDDVVEDKRETDVDKTNKAISTADLFLKREQEIERQKYRIGIICSGILEKPENKIGNFKALFELMEEEDETGSPNLLSVRKIAMISISEVFKDILPEYRVGQVNTKMITVRKTTLERITYETALLQQFKKFLSKLEKITGFVTKKGGKRSPENILLAEVAVTSLSDILLSHPYFNYGQNIAQLLVYMLNCRYPTMRVTANKCLCDLFKNDKKLDMTLFTIRRINHLIKSKSNNVHTEVISCLLALQIKNINLDAEKENELKQKKLEAHKQRLLNLSKRERKRRKKLAELNRELEETKAEENKQTKSFKLTEIVKMVFTIYFRILKNDPNSKLLSACLEGLARYAHIINFDFFSDLVDILHGLLETGELGYREQLHCIQSTFAILSGQGEVLNIDPIRFYSHLYRNLLCVNAGKNHEDFLIILETLNNVLIKRRKDVSQHRLLAFVKRILTLCLQVLHNGALGGLAIVKGLMQLTSSLEIILDTDTSVGSGRFDPELEDPEYCNANCTSLYEISSLMRHYHPTVRKMAVHIAAGVPATGEGSLPPEIGKLSYDQLFTQFDSSQMSFNPPIPAPKISEPKLKKSNKRFFNEDFEKSCKIPKQSKKEVENGIFFYDFYCDQKCIVSSNK